MQLELLSFLTLTEDVPLRFISIINFGFIAIEMLEWLNIYKY